MVLRLSLFICLVATIATAHESRRILLSGNDCKEACEAVERTDPEVIRSLRDSGAQLCNCICDDSTGAGLIHASVEAKCGLCVDLLTSSSANCPCDQKDNFGKTAVHYAGEQCRMEILQDLLQAGCSVDTFDNVNNTPLCVASRTNNEECGGVVRKLMAKDAKPCAICNDNVSAIDGCVNKVVCDVMNQDIEEEC